jgi:uncharacterized protein (TIRG00374 family)
MMAAQAGVSVPHVYAVVPAERNSALIALSVPDGSTLATLAEDTVTDDGLDDLWCQLRKLHTARMAHRALDSTNLSLDGNHATLLGLKNAHFAATDEQCDVDRAELLVSTAALVGADRAIAAAVRVMSTADLKDALPFIQPAALPFATRRNARRSKGLIDQVRTGLQQQLGVEEVQLAELQRISIMRVMTWVGFAVLAFFALTLITSWSSIRESMSGLDWVWVLPVAIATVLGTVGGALSLTGSVVRQLPLGQTTVIMFGQSFLNRFTPANAGGMAMRIRYLQKGGSDGTAAATAIGLTSAASGVMQVVFIAFFFLWNGSNPASGVGSNGGSSLNGTVVIVFVVAVVVAGAVVARSPKLRKWFVDFVRSTFEKVRDDFGELARRPSKLVLLFGGAGLAKLSTIMAFVLSCRAFDIELGFVELGALYLAANTVASAVPSPGGVGAIEAALVFVLTNAGVMNATAWAAVLLFRLVNYWAPTVPGYAALKISERRELV